MDRTEAFVCRIPAVCLTGSVSTQLGNISLWPLH